MARKPKTQKVVEKIGAACHLAGVTEDVAKRAKGLGCPAFMTGNRIDWKLLKDWCKENADKLEVTGENLSLREQKLNEEVRKLRRNNDIDDGMLMLVSAHEAELDQMAQAAQGVLYSRIDSLSVSTAGQTAVHNHAILTAWVDEAIGKLSRGEGE